MEDNKQELNPNQKTIPELIEKYGEEIVNKRVKELEEQLQGKVETLDETYFNPEISEPEPPTDEEVIQLIGLISELYLAEGRTLRILDLQKNKQTKYVTSALRQRINNLFVNNRVLLDVFLKKFEISEVDYLNPLANSIETITNLFISCKPEDRIHCITEFKSYLENKYIKKDEK